MKLTDMKDSFSEFWAEFSKEKTGVVGLVLFFLFILIVIFEPILLPFEDANDRWRDITYWADNSKSAPPAWTNWFSSEKKATTERYYEYTTNEQDLGGMTVMEYTFDYDYQFDDAPNDIIIHADATGAPLIIIKVVRPDGEEVEVYNGSFSAGETTKDFRLSVDNNSRSILYNFGVQYENRDSLKDVKAGLIKTTNTLFAKAEEGILRDPQALKGDYQIVIQSIYMGDDDKLENPYIVMPGKVSGVLGTDSSKRDIWTGVLAGVKWALLIGILTAVVSVFVGVIYGVISAYLGGWRDALMQRIFEVFVSVPLLPVLIVMSAIFEPSIWTMVGMMVLFFWTGSVKTVRSMALQIKEETYIEASKALGASNFRIIFKHMVPLLIPYSFSSMALFIPRAVVYEATISLLGLGDAKIVTWGQILSDALSGGAVMNGLWWWVVPPGLMIAFMGMAFAFIGFSLDKILHPKLRTR
ncbi:MAG TPA: ABC transporter permease [Thermotogota bacterium]|nr:ABC transporter permease [Thermotogota bacterium]